MGPQSAGTMSGEHWHLRKKCVMSNGSEKITANNASEQSPIGCEVNGVKPMGNTRFDFQAKVFQTPGARFVLAATGEDRKKAMFAVSLGKAEGLIRLQSLRSAFGIASEGHDDQLLMRIEEGLMFVSDIRPGDSIPSEILDGTASWSVRPKHKKIARDRIQARLLSWMTGETHDMSDGETVKRLMRMPETKSMLRDAFKRAAIKLALEKPEDVVDRVEIIVRELCYIEALRDRCMETLRIRAMLNALIKPYRDDPRVSEEIGRCRKFIIEGTQELFTPLALVDIKFSDVVDALQNLDGIIEDVRRTRDNVHYLLMEWDRVIGAWEEVQPRRSAYADKAINTLYRFLAAKFASGRSLLRRAR